MNAPYWEIREREDYDDLDMSDCQIVWVERHEREDYDEDDYHAWKEEQERKKAEALKEKEGK